MTIEYIRYDVADADALMSAYNTARLSLDNSPHCLGYELSRCTDAPNVFMLRIIWDSVDGHMNGFRKSADFQRFLVSVRPFITEILEMRHYELTAIVSHK
jgi:quinol monooxygenase YgiN